MIKIAIVDDEKDVILQINEYLKKLGTELHKEIETVSFSNGLDFLDNYI